MIGRLGWAGEALGCIVWLTVTAWTTMLAAWGGAGCAAAPARIPDTGPGGLPNHCRLPDCAILEEFSSIDEAVFAGFEALKLQPDWKAREYAGCVFEVRPGTYRATYTARHWDDEFSRTHCLAPPAPLGSQKVAELHNHPTNEEFSEGVDIHRRTTLPQYLLAPSGTIYKYEPATRTKSKWEGERWIPLAQREGDHWKPL